MKKKIVLCVCILFALTGIIALVKIITMFAQPKPSDVTAFTLSDYQYFIDNSPSNEILGCVSDSQDAQKKLRNYG